MATKVIGWGTCKSTHTPASGTATVHNDIIEGSASLSVEEGEEQEALIEGGEAEARRKMPDKYILEYDRRLGSDDSSVKPGFTDDAGSVKIEPPTTGAIAVELSGVSLYISLRFDSTDGAVAHYTYKTKGATNADGELTDVSLSAVAS